MEKKTSALTPPYGRFLIRLTKPFPDFDFSFIKPVRRRAVRTKSIGRVEARHPGSHASSARRVTGKRL